MSFEQIGQLLNSLSPLAVIAGLATIIGMLVWNQRTTKAAHDKVMKIESNDLHELPEMMRTLQQMQVTLIALDSYLRTRLNGKGTPRVD